LFGCLRRLVNFVVFLVVVAAILAGAVYFFVLPDLKDRLADEIRRQMMLPAESNVDVETGTLTDLAQGKLASVRISASRARLGRYDVRDLSLSANDVRFNVAQSLLTRKAVLTSIGAGKISFTVTESDLSKAWERSASKAGLKDAQVKLDPGTTTLSATIKFLGKNLRLSATGEFAAEGGTEIVFNAKQAKIQGTEMPKFLLSFVGRIEPHFSLTDVPVPLTIKRLTTKKGMIIVEGETKGKGLDETQPAADAEAAPSDGAP
jgi:hypothetical protein